MSDGSAHGLLEMPCLGRPFQLGMLYDCRNDGLIPGVTLWGPDTLGTAKHAMMEGSDFEIITEDSFNQKTLHLDVSAGLKLSVLGGLVKAGGSGKFLYDRTTSKNQARVSLRYKSTSRFEQLNMSQLGKFEYPRVFEDDIATHVVTAVQYGADAVFVFDRQVDSTEKFYQVHGKLEAMISVLPSIDLQVGGSADLGLQKKGNEGKEKIHCKFYGDFILPKNPTTYQDAVRVYQELPKLLGGAGYPNSVPKKVWLYPLSKLDSKVQRMVREISSFLIDDLQEVMESLHDQEVRINDLIKSEVCSCFEGIKADLEKLRRFIGAYNVTLMKCLSTLLPKVRGGGEEEAKLAELLEMNYKSPLSCEKVSSWIKEKKKEVDILTVYLTDLKKHEIQFAFESDEMVTLTSGLSADSVLCFDFNIPAGKDSQLQRIENYLHGRRVEQELQLTLTSWYKSQELRQQLQRFVSFVTRNCKDSACKYVVTNGYDSDSSRLGVMLVFIDACPTEFEPPDQPGVPLASSKTHDSLQLSWDKPKYGSDSVQSYIVAYRSVDDPPSDQWSTQTSSEECLVLTKLTPGSLYHFKVTAQSAVGSSPESEVGEESLPPDQPGKPETMNKTHNSLQLKWTKPEHGASLVSSYIVHYRSENGPPDQWSTQTSSEECSVLTKLTPGSLYHLKVTAESPPGPSPESELGKERLPPDQPGIPQVTQKTHKSIQLKWEKPEYGAHIVQCYEFFYRSEKEIEKWQTRCTNKPNISLGEITPGTLYYFKVKAQSVAGSSPFSEESEERLPPDQPGKPTTTKKTHNSMQLKWSKPEHGATIVHSYVVHYRSMDDPSDQWSTQTSSEECLVLTKLTPGSLYHFKVTAESTVGSSPESVVCEITLPPDQPGKLQVFEKTYNSIRVKWDKPKYGAHIVQSYVFFYCSENESDKWLSKATNKESMSLNGITPGNMYFFKVTAQSVAGSSPESEVGEIRLPPEHPGKPYATNKTHNNLQLKWTKPKHGAGIVSSYTVSYRSLNDQANKWCMKTVKEECLVLTKLTPGSMYHFKVTAESAVGSSPESEVGEARLPPDQPGKPNGSNATCNTIQLKWNQPKHGAETVQCYTISYQSASARCETLKTTSKHECVTVSNLASKTVYTFKVRAESTAGPGPESELSDPIETVAPSLDKPQVSNITHNSVKLSWKKPSECVLLYTVLYCIVDDHSPTDPAVQWHGRVVSNSSCSVYLDSLLPGTKYVFKVRGEMNEGASLVSDLTTLMLPPSKPYATSITCNSMQLSWKKPVRGAESGRILYTVYYKAHCDVANPSIRWEECYCKTSDVIVSDLLSSKAYVFKVGLETNGIMAMSELSDPIATVSMFPPPGKPYATSITHNSIQLSWKKPVRGAESGGIIYTVYYKAHCDVANPSIRWEECYSKTSDVVVSDLFSSKAYVFKVGLETNGIMAMSELSDPILTMLPPPGKPYASNIGYQNFWINWDKPKYDGIICYSISYCTSDDYYKTWQTLVTGDNNNKYEFSASPETVYFFTVSAKTATECSSNSDVSDPYETFAEPWGARLLPKCKKIESKEGENPNIYQLPLHIVKRNTVIIKAVVGEKQPTFRKYSTGVPHKVLMVVGATGAGKSTLINGMANYIMGVDWEDEYRFKLISEETAHDQTVSQMNHITAYTFQISKGSPLLYTLTIINTPGFGDSRGVDRDKLLVKQIKEFVQGDEGIDQLHGIGFVAPSPQAQLTATQKYMFHSILSVFGNDVADNIFLMVTFCDGKQPPVLGAVKNAGVPFRKLVFKFNNSALFANNRTNDEFDQMFWKMGRYGFKAFFDHFRRAETRSLQKSREVLQEREQLEIIIQGLQRQISADLNEIDEMRIKGQILEELEVDIIANREFIRKVTITKQRKKSLPVGHYVTNCLKCNFICHEDCKIPRNEDMFRCEAMDKKGTRDATCRICPQKCSWELHVNSSYMFEFYQDTETVTLDKLRDKYKSAMTNKGEVVAVMENIEMELDRRGAQVIKTIEQARQCLLRLQKIALRSDTLTEVEYIDILIKSEKLEASSGWSDRVATLNDVREQAVILSTVRDQKGAELSAVKYKRK